MTLSKRLYPAAVIGIIGIILSNIKKLSIVLKIRFDIFVFVFIFFLP